MNKAAVESDANQHDINKWFPLKIIGERKRIIYIFMPIFSDCHADCHNNHYDSQYFIKYEIWHSNPSQGSKDCSRNQCNGYVQTLFNVFVTFFKKKQMLLVRLGQL